MGHTDDISTATSHDGVIPWASYQIRKIAGCACAGDAGNVFRHLLQRKPLVSDPSMHHVTCVTHMPWCMPGSLTRGCEENVPSVPSACATCNFTYRVRGPWKHSLPALCLGNPLPMNSAHKIPVIWSFGDFFVISLNPALNKESSDKWFGHRNTHVTSL